jgi:hypothetical protein
MPSMLKSESARINRAKSQGPITAAGREKSSQNALKHGLTSGSAIVLDCECQDDFDEIMSHFLATYKPANPEELDLVEEMVASRWRIRRLWTIETSLLNAEILNQKSVGATHDPSIHLGLAFRALADDSRALALVSRYESRFHRIYDHAYETLRELQHARESQAQTAQPMIEQVPTSGLPEPAPELSPEPSTDVQPSPSHNRPHLVESRPSLLPNPEPHPAVSGLKHELRNEPTGPSESEPAIKA